MAWYRAGTVSVTNNSSAVTGAGTAWVAAAAIGETFLGPDGQSYEIVAINGATSMTIAPAYKSSTASGQNYAIMPTQGYLRDLAAAAAALVESYSSVKNNAGAGKFAAGTSASPSLRNAADENSGLNFKGNDQIALVTAGVERLAISADGTPSGTAVEKMPVSGPQLAALNAKAPLLNPEFGGTVYTNYMQVGLGNPRTWTANPNLALRLENNGIAGLHFIGAPTAEMRIWFSDTDQQAVGSLVYDHNNDSMNIGAGVGGFRSNAIYRDATASAANVFVGSDGHLYRSTSSERYKTLIEPINPDLAQAVIDGAEPMWYRSTAAADNPDWGYFGLSAEQLAQVAPQYVHWAHPLKTVEVVERFEVDVDTGEVDANEEPILRKEMRTTNRTEQVPDTDAPLQPEGVMYERLTVPLLWHAQQQQALIARLEQSLQSLAARVDALEAV